MEIRPGGTAADTRERAQGRVDRHEKGDRWVSRLCECNAYINQRVAQILVNSLYFFVNWIYMFRTIISPSSGATFNCAACQRTLGLRGSRNHRQNSPAISRL